MAYGLPLEIRINRMFWLQQIVTMANGETTWGGSHRSTATSIWKIRLCSTWPELLHTVDWPNFWHDLFLTPMNKTPYRLWCRGLVPNTQFSVFLVRFQWNFVWFWWVHNAAQTWDTYERKMERAILARWKYFNYFFFSGFVMEWEWNWWRMLQIINYSICCVDKKGYSLLQIHKSQACAWKAPLTQLV